MALLRRRQLLRLITSLIAVCFTFMAALVGPSWAQTAKTVKIVVPFPRGGGADILARLLAEQVGRMQPASVVVENRPGADIVIGQVCAAPNLLDSFASSMKHMAG